MCQQVEITEENLSKLKGTRVHKFSEMGPAEWDKKVEELNNGMWQL